MVISLIIEIELSMALSLANSEQVIVITEISEHFVFGLQFIFRLSMSKYLFNLFQTIYIFSLTMASYMAQISTALWIKITSIKVNPDKPLIKLILKTYSQVSAVDMVADGSAPKICQTTEGASFEPSLQKKELQKVSALKELLIQLTD